MHKNLILLPLIFAASPALAQPVPQLPPELTDPAAAQRLTGVMQALSNAFLDMRVGEVRAAIEGRPATRAEHNMTVRDMARRKDPDFDRHVQQRIGAVGPVMQQGVRAVNQALPQVMQDVAQAQESIERAIANLPDPNYPRR